MTVHPELDDPDVCFIGKVQHLSRKMLHLREITPRATWSDSRGKFQMGRITRVDVGGNYEQALVQVATSTHHPQIRLTPVLSLGNN